MGSDAAMTTTKNPPQTPRLRQSGSGMNGKSLPGNKMRLILGRGTTADVVLTDDGASRAHAAIAWNGQSWSIEDLGSRNGTKVNEDVLRGNRALRDGDRIRIGKTELVFELQTTPGTVSVTKRGTRVEDCTLLERIDAGSAGETWRVKDDTGRDRVVKIIKPSLAASPEAMATFIAGARAQMRLVHPHILPVHAVSTGPRPVIVMAQARTSLSGWLAIHGPLSLAKTLGLARNVASALDAASSARLVHLALHPGNILFNEHEQVLLTDFALLDPVTPLANRPLQAPWLAPEEVTGAVTDDLCNQFRLGLILFHCLTGLAPFAGSNLQAVARARLTGRLSGLERVESLPPVIPRLLARMLCRDPRQRFADWVELLRAIEKAERNSELPPVREDSLISTGLATAGTSVVARRARPRDSSSVPVVAPSHQEVRSTERIYAGSSSRRRSASAHRPAPLMPWSSWAGLAVLIMLAMLTWHFMHVHPAAGVAARTSTATSSDERSDADLLSAPNADPSAASTPSLTPPLADATPSVVAQADPVVAAPAAVAVPSAAAVPAASPVSAPPATTAPVPQVVAPAAPAAVLARPAVAAAAASTELPGPPSSDAPTLAAPFGAMPALHVKILLATEIGANGDQQITALRFDDQGRVLATGNGFTALVNPRTGTAAMHGSFNPGLVVQRRDTPSSFKTPVTLALGAGHVLSVSDRLDGGQRLPLITDGSWSWWSLSGTRAAALGLGADALVNAVFERPDAQFTAIAWSEGANSCLARDPSNPAAVLPVGTSHATGASTWVYVGNGADGSLLHAFALGGTALAVTADPWGRIYLSSAQSGRDDLGMHGTAGVTILAPDLGRVLLDAHLGGWVAKDHGWETFTTIAYHHGMLALGGTTSASQLHGRHQLQRHAGGGQDGLLVVLQLWDPALSDR